MSLLDLLSKAQGGQGLAQLAGQFGLDESKAGELSALLAPAIGSAAKKQAEGGGLGMLTKMLDANGGGSPLDDIIGKFLK
ncbi:MAG: hypothetical protein L3J36_06930 [Rhodobacteraceae bacterium]|nr:hypothetical protein [Paracoccaceae bacterium]